MSIIFDEMTAYGALKLHHPDVFAYFAVPSGAITICIKMVSIFVQGPKAKRALILLTVRFLCLVYIIIKVSLV